MHVPTIVVNPIVSQRTHNLTYSYNVYGLILTFSTPVLGSHGLGALLLLVTAATAAGAARVESGAHAADVWLAATGLRYPECQLT